MTAFHKYFIELALEEAMTLVGKEVPIIDEERVKDSLLGARRDFIKLEETLNELDQFQTEIRDNMLEWMNNLKKMKGQEAAAEEEVYDQFCVTLDVKTKQRSFGAKVREWKKALKEAQVLIDDAMEEKRERLAMLNARSDGCNVQCCPKPEHWRKWRRRSPTGPRFSTASCAAGQI
jgi:hypothetical protein